jgi:hypothetical protein
MSTMPSSSSASPLFTPKRRITSERVLRRVNGINKNPTPVLAVLPTIKSPAVVSLTLPTPVVAPFAVKYPESPMTVRRRERVRKYMDTPGTFLHTLASAPILQFSVKVDEPVQSWSSSSPQSNDSVGSYDCPSRVPDLSPHLDSLQRLPSPSLPTLRYSRRSRSNRLNTMILLYPRLDH